MVVESRSLRSNMTYLPHEMKFGTPGIDHSAVGVVITGTAGEELTLPNLIYQASNGEWEKTNATAMATTKGALAIVMESITIHSSGAILKYGFLRDDSWYFSQGATLYVGETNGAITETAPSDVGDQLRIVGYAQTSSIVWFDPEATIISI
jgi:hypothetical protein